MKVCPRGEYPRPMMVRDHWENLNGAWEFSFDEPTFDRQILVPFVYQCPKSGIGRKENHETVYYRKRFSWHKGQENSRVLIHFGAVDYECDVWVNGEHVCHNTGGHLPFSAEITCCIKEHNELVVRVRDDHADLEKPRGKQCWTEKPDGIFYTPSTGIWQTVWLEEVPEEYIESVRWDTDYDSRTVRLCCKTSAAGTIQAKVSFQGRHICTVSSDAADKDGELLICLNHRALGQWNFEQYYAWTPEHPNLFDAEIEFLSREGQRDRVRSYFGVRTVSVENGIFCLNHRPCYQKLILDQAYWPESLLTAPEDEDFCKDIRLCKEMGFNGVRLHQKTEDPRFLYHADRMGLLVWDELPSAYAFSPAAVQRGCAEWARQILQDVSHPCVVAWVPLNESWGVPQIEHDHAQQAYSVALYSIAKALDGSRPVISNDGWEHTQSDMLTVHDYRDAMGCGEGMYGPKATIVGRMPAGRRLFAKGWHYEEQPILISEFGGIAYQSREAEGWGYSRVQSARALEEGYRACVEPLLKESAVQGFCYTQLTDVEQEINGLLTDRREPKVAVERIRAINRGEKEAKNDD